MISGAVFQGVFDEVSKYLLPEWEKLVVYLEYGAASYSFSFYVKTQDKFVKCYDLPGVSEDELLDSFSRIDEMVSMERKAETGNLWSNMTMVVDSDGRMKTDFDYTDLSQEAYRYMLEWKDKYLK